MIRKTAVSLILILLILPINVHAREFLNTLLHLNFSGSYNFPTGDLIDFEETISHSSHFEYSYGVFVDIAPFKPFILGDESHALKIGLRGSYKFHTVQESVKIRQKSYKGDFIRYQAWMAGPVLRYSPMLKFDSITERYSSRWGLTFYVLYGTIIDGSMTSNMTQNTIVESVTGFLYNLSLYDSSLATTALSIYTQNALGAGIYKTKISGHKVDIGFGGEVGIFLFNLGINMYYSGIFIEREFPTNYALVDTSAYLAYKAVKKNTRIDNFCIEVYLGIPIEWSFFPRVQ